MYGYYHIGLFER